MSHSSEESSPPTGSAQPAPKRPRWLWPVAIVLLTVMGTVIGNRLSDSRTGQVISIFYGAGFLIIGLAGWWLLFSGATLRRRVLVLTGVLTLSACAAISSVREVWFEGDMRPHLRFRWDPPSAAELAEQWLAENAPARQDVKAETEGTQPDRKSVV